MATQKYDSKMDKQVGTTYRFQAEGVQSFLHCAFFAYNGGAPRLQIMRKLPTSERYTTERVVKTGRFGKEELSLLTRCLCHMYTEQFGEKLDMEAQTRPEEEASALPVDDEKAPF